MREEERHLAQEEEFEQVVKRNIQRFAVILDPMQSRGCVDASLEATQKMTGCVKK